MLLQQFYFIGSFPACDDPPGGLVNNGHVDITKKCVGSGDRFQIKCDCNYFIDGSGWATCDPDGSWKLDGSCRGDSLLS